MRPRMTAAVGTAIVAMWAVLSQTVPAIEPPDWPITTLDTGPVLETDIAVDASGNALVVWGTGNHIRTSRYAVAAGAWSPAITLSNTSHLSFGARVAINAAGDAIAVWNVWIVSSETRYIGLSRYDAATATWQPAVEFQTDGLYPEVVIDDHGSATVVWEQILRYEIDYYYYYPYPIFELRAARYDTGTAQWSAPVTLAGEPVQSHDLAIDSSGTVTAVWSRGGFIEAARSQSGTTHWSPVTTLATASSFSFPKIAVDGHGDVVALWSQNQVFQTARFSAASSSWSQPVLIGTPWTFDASMGVDAAGNVTIVYAVSAGTGTPTKLSSVSYDESANTWTAPSDIASNELLWSPNVAVDPAGNATVVWAVPSFLQVAHRPAGGAWNTITTISASPQVQPWIAADFAGSVFLLWANHGSSPELKAVRAAAELAPPTVTQAISTSGQLTIYFDTPPVLNPHHAVLNYEYSIDDGTTWIARDPASTISPLVIDGLLDGVSYPVRLRAIATTGPGHASGTLMLTPGLAAPANLNVASLVGNLVTLAWTPPPGGVPPTGYVVEGGTTPGVMLVRLPSAGTGTIFSVSAPVGVFHVRVRATIGQAESEPSNEITINVGVPAAPSAPTNLLGHADGSTVTLTWQNTVGGGAATGIFLDVSGAATGSLPLPLADRFTVGGVPPGTYTVAVRAVNVAGPSAPSNAVTLTFPGTCSAPLTPTNFAAAKNGNTVHLAWSPPPAGTAPTGYVVLVSGSFNGSLPVSGPTFSGTAQPGTYSVSVAAANTCGTGAATPAKTITIP